MTDPRDGEKIRVEKYHGTGNDFAVLEAEEAAPIADLPALATALCDRESGLATSDGRVTGADDGRTEADDGQTGADGLLVLALEDAARDERRGDGEPPRVTMNLYQPDGSTAAMCGNGVRVVAAWTTERLETDAAVVETGAGDRHATVDRTAGDGGDESVTVTVEMGMPSIAPADVPLIPTRDEPLLETAVGELPITAVDTGVPHAVAFVEDVDAVDLETVAPPVRHADVFPEGANVTLASPAETGFRQRTFERGVEGETDACGTGAVAIAAAARHTGRIRTAESVPVRPPGGRLEVTVTEAGATLRGPVEREFDAAVDPTLAR